MLIMLINNKTVYIASFSNYVSQLIDIFEKIKQWRNLKKEFHLGKILILLSCSR